MKSMFNFIFCLLIVSTTISSQTLSPAVQTAFESIDPLDAYNYNKIIASDEFKGRLTGTESFKKAALWAAGKFEEWGLKPIDPVYGYLQPYNAPYSQIHSTAMDLIFPDGDTLTLEPAKDFIPLGFSDKGSHLAGIAFAGWGIYAPELGYDDYSGIDVKDKFVLCFRGTPNRKDTSFKHYDKHRTRMETAKAKGALGLLYIYKDVLANPNGDHIPDFMPAMISNDTGDKLLAEKEITSEELKKKLRNDGTPFSFELNTNIIFSVDAEYYPDATGYNVAGYIEGTDPELKYECVVVGGHLDHCGTIAGIMFPGANDNGSGSAVVMEIADTYAAMTARPKRSVMFVLFGGEEKGLRGSAYFADHFPAQFTKVDGMFNHDMNGEGEGTNYGYSLEDPHFKETLLKANEFVGTFRNSFEIKPTGSLNSDYAPFFKKGASVVAFFSNGPHLHYHQSGDTIYRINPDMLGDIAKVSFLGSYFWADR